MIRWGVLGPLEVSIAGRPLPPLRPKYRATLGYLLVHAQHTITPERLVEAVWGEAFPDTARGQLHNAMSGIRTWLGAVGAADLLVSRPSGYAILPKQGTLDLDVFRAGVSQSHSDSVGLRDALALWRGPVLADISAPFVDGVRVSLDEQRIAVCERLAELELADGRHDALIPELMTLTHESPLRERLRCLLMTAMYRAGRHADALDVARSYRLLLAEDKGLDPSPNLVELERAILVRDPALDAAQPIVIQPPATRPFPAQLPASAMAFSGRLDELSRLDEMLAGGVSARTAAIVGPGGMGKTALTLHWAHHRRDKFPDGQLYVNLHGFSGTEAVHPLNALQGFLRAIGTPVGSIPPVMDEAAAMYRTLLADRRMLVVLDNARDADQVRPLLPAGSGCLTLVTSRDRLTGLTVIDGAVRISVDVLPMADSMALLGGIIGKHRLLEERAAAEDLAELCGSMPLALCIAAAALNDDPNRSMANHVGQLRSGRLAELDRMGEDASLRVVFDHSYLSLEPATAQLFRLLGLLTTHTFTVDVAAALTGKPTDLVRQAIRQLTSGHLLEVIDAERLTVHDLIREYAAQRALTEDTASHRLHALGRVLDWYQVIAQAAGRVLAPHRNRIKVDVDYEPDSIPFATTHDSVATFLSEERQNLLPITRLAIEHGQHLAALHLAYLLQGFFLTRGFDADSIAVLSAGLEAAQRLADPAEEAGMHIDLGAAYALTGRRDDAIESLEAAVRLHRTRADIAGEAAARMNIGLVHDLTQDNTAAVAAYQQALPLAEKAGDPRRLGQLLVNIAESHVKLGDQASATEALEKALAAQRELDDPMLEAVTLDLLGLAKLRGGDHAGALDCLHRAGSISRKLANRMIEATTLGNLGLVYTELKDHRAAIDCHEQARALFAALGDQQREQVEADRISFIRRGSRADAP